MNSSSALRIFSKSTIDLCRRSCLLSLYSLRRSVAAYKPPQAQSPQAQSPEAQGQTSIIDRPVNHYGTTTAKQINHVGSIVPSRRFHLSTPTFVRGFQRKENETPSEGFALTGKDMTGKYITCNIYPRCLGKDIVIIFGGEEYRFTVSSGELRLCTNFVLKGKDITGKDIICKIGPQFGIGEDIIIILGGEEYRFTAIGVFISGLDLAFLHKLFMIGISVVFMGFIFTIRMKLLTDLQLYLEVKRRKRISFIGIILCLPLLLLVSSE